MADVGRERDNSIAHEQYCGKGKSLRAAQLDSGQSLLKTVPQKKEGKLKTSLHC